MATLTHPVEFVERVTEREWSITRDFESPRELVFKAWIVPTLLARWWGPKGFTNPVCDLDVRPGGAYRIVTRDPDGIEYPLTGVYLEVLEPERLVLTDVWDEHPAEWHEMLKALNTGDEDLRHEALNTVTFDENARHTTLTLRSLFESAAMRDAMMKMGLEHDWSQSFDRLDDLLRSL